MNNVGKLLPDSLKSPRYLRLSELDLLWDGKLHLPFDAWDPTSQSACKPIPYSHIQGSYTLFSHCAAT